MGCCQAHSNLLLHVQPQKVMLFPMIFRKAKSLIRHPASAEFFATPICVNNTTAVLLLKRLTCFLRRFSVPAIPSDTNHARNFLDIFRSFISSSAPGFVGVIRLACNFFGHSKRQIVGSSASFPGIQPPPTRSSDASTQTRNSGSTITNYFDVVGLRAASFSSVLQSHNACFSTGKSFHRTIRGFTCRILVIGVIKIFPVGTAVASYQIFK